MATEEYKCLGNFSAVDPAYSRGMCCHDCKVEWTGCWDNFMCPQCGQGELPNDKPGELIDILNNGFYSTTSTTATTGIQINFTLADMQAEKIDDPLCNGYLNPTFEGVNCFLVPEQIEEYKINY